MKQIKSQTSNSQNEILNEYEKKSEEIVTKMFKILNHAHRKADDKSYRDILTSLEKYD